MRASLPGPELARSLQSLLSIPGRASLPILSGFLIEADGQSLAITAHNLTIGARIVLPANVEEEGAAVVPSAALAGLTKHIESEVALSTASEALKVSWQTGRATLPIIDADEYPRPPFVGPTFTVPGDVFCKAVQQVQYAAANEKDPELTPDTAIIQSVRLSLQPNGVVSLATDRVQVASFRDPTPAGDSTETLLFPASSLQVLLKAAPQAEEYRFGLSKRGITAQANRLTFYSRVIDGTYPDIVGCLPRSFPVTCVTSRTTLVAMAERAMAVWQGRTVESFALTLDADTITASLTATPFAESAPAKGTGTLTTYCNPEVLLGSLRQLEGDNVELGAVDSATVIRLRAPGGGNFVAFVMPVLPEGVDTEQEETDDDAAEEAVF